MTGKMIVTLWLYIHVVFYFRLHSSPAVFHHSDLCYMPTWGYPLCDINCKCLSTEIFMDYKSFNHISLKCRCTYWLKVAEHLLLILLVPLLFVIVLN